MTTRQLASTVAAHHLMASITLSASGYDVIGDLHGHADTLRALLETMGYEEVRGAYRHPTRRAAFVGDFIDRGPKIRETLHLVRAMVEAGEAVSVLGNHEWNGIRYHTLGADGAPLRPHSEKNARQHRSTLDQLSAPNPDEWQNHVAWFKTLPFALELDGLRVVHASWAPTSLEILAGRRLDDVDLLTASASVGGLENLAINTLLNGPEVSLPDGHHYLDKDGHARREVRARWFGQRTNGHPLTYRELMLTGSEQIPNLVIDADLLSSVLHYPEDEPPVIFGHYWMPPTQPGRLARNAACVDYSVAKAGGLLAAYRWSGERELSDTRFVTVSQR